MVVVVLYEEIPLPSFVFAIVDVVVLAPPIGPMPPRTPSVFVLEYIGVVEVEMKNPLVVVVVDVVVE